MHISESGEFAGRHSGRWLAGVVGLLLALACTATGLWLQPSSRSLLFWLLSAGTVTGVAWALLALVLPPGRLLGMLRILSGNALVFALMLGLAEGGFRLAGVDFNAFTHEASDPRADYPFCFRMPEAPLGDVYFHRQGPMSWTGTPLRTFLKLQNGTDNAYQDEAPLTLSYDKDGFRNPDNLQDWDAVVVGDSFVESGSLPADRLFTSEAARLSGLKIRNLGVCMTGTLSHVEFLKRFGSSPSCRQAVLSFYDGNDIRDTEDETELLERHKATGGERPDRTLRAQTSLVKAGYQLAKRIASPSPARRYQDAWLVAGDQQKAITLRPSPMPLEPETMSPRQKEILAAAVRQWAETARGLQQQPWLLYIPANNRTYHGLVKFEAEAEKAVREWKPGTLPAHMRQLCETNGIRFIDACGVLRQAAEKGTLVYNPILDTHLNAEGSRLIGELLAKHLADAKTGGVKPTQP